MLPDGGRGTQYSPEHDLIHDPVQEDLVLNKWRLQIALESIKKDSNRPRFDDSFPWIGVLLAFLLALIPSDFQTFLSIPGSAWTAVALGGCIVAGFKVMSIWWEVWKRREEKHLTAATVVEEIVSEMKTNRDKVRQQSQALPLAEIVQPDTRRSEYTKFLQQYLRRQLESDDPPTEQA